MSKLVASAQIQRQKLLRLRKEGPNIKALNRQSKLRLILYSFYALIALFPVITFFSSFSTSLRFLIDREIEVQSQLSHAGLDTIHSSLLYADSYTDSLISTGYTQSYIAASSEPRNQLVSRIQKMHDAFPLLSDQNSLLSRVYIYSRNSDSGQQTADFINIVAWRNTADFIARYFKKGSAICITGSIQTRSWQDQQGQRRYATEVVADEAMFVDSRSESGMSDGYQAPAFSSGASVTPSFEEHNTDDDLPF